MEEVQNKKDNNNLFENNIQSINNTNNSNECQNIIYKYSGKMAFWKKKNKKTTIDNKESKIDNQKKLEQRSLDRQINIYANEKFIKEYGFGFNCFI